MTYCTICANNHAFYLDCWCLHLQVYVCSIVYLYLGSLINSFVGKANYYGTHVVQNKRCTLQENVVSKQLALHVYDKQLINMLLTTKC